MSVLTCREIEERLPWFLHGSLHPAERAELAAHLAGCAGCRGALAATREASALFAGHPEAATLVSYAFGLPLDPADGLERATLELHLAHCADCREELRLVEADRIGSGGGGGDPVLADARSAAGLAVAPGSGSGSAVRRVRRVRLLALAAVLVVASGLSVWLAMRARMPVPDVRIAIVELLPTDSRTRGPAAADAAAARIDRRVTTTLLLVTDRAEAWDEVRVRLGDPAAAQPQWQASGLAPAASGAYALLLPAGALRPGEVGIELEGRIGSDWARIALYRAVVAP